MDSIILAFSWLKFTDMLSFTNCVVICTQTANINIFDLKGSIPNAVY